MSYLCISAQPRFHSVREREKIEKVWKVGGRKEEQEKRRRVVGLGKRKISWGGGTDNRHCQQIGNWGHFSSKNVYYVSYF